MIELLIVLGILPVIIGGIAVAMISSFKSEGAVTQRVASSHDAQITSAYFVRDVNATSFVSTSTTNPVCASSTTRSQLLGLRWSTGGTTVSVTYSLSTNGSTPYLVRTFCHGTAAPVSIDLSSQAFNGLVGTPTVSNACAAGTSSCAVNGAHTGVAVSVQCQNGATTCANGGLVATYPSSGGALGISKIVLTVTESPSQYQYSLTASPRNQSSQVLLPAGSAGPPLVLLGTSSPALSCQNKSGVTVNGALAVDSTQPGSLSFGPNSSGLSATQVYTEPLSPAGSVVTPSKDYTGPVIQGPSFPDPYAGLPDPTSATTYTGNSIVGPGEYLNPVSITGPVNFAPGVYIFEQGLSVSGNSSTVLTGSGVTFFIGIPNAPTDVAQTAAYSVSGNGTINLTAPTSGPFAGISIFQSRSDPTAMNISGNGANNSYGGVIYAPSATVSADGNGSVATGSIVAGALGCAGNGGISIGFAVISSSPQVTPITSGGTEADVVSVDGSPGLGAPMGLMTFYVCPPSVPAGSCTSAHWTQVGSPVALTPVVNDLSTATSQSSPYTTPGTWCFVASYNPNGNPNYGASSDTSTDGCFVVDGPVISFPTATTYTSTGGGTWSNSDTCGSSAMCGTLADVGATITGVQFSLSQASSGKCWTNSSNFKASCPNMVNVTSFTQSAWSENWAASNFPSGTYTLTVSATDSLGDTATTSVTFTMP